MPWARPTPTACRTTGSLAPGDYVRVPLGPRQVIGVVWDVSAETTVEPHKLRAVAERYDTPPMPELHRRFLQWVANYTVSDAGAVLRMCLRVPEALGPPKTVTGYRRGGPEPKRMTPQRARVLEVADDAVAWSAGDLAEMAGVTSAVVRGLVEAGTLLPVAASELCAVRGAGPVSASRQDCPGSRLRPLSALQSPCRRANDSRSPCLDGVTGSGKTEVYLRGRGRRRRGRQAGAGAPAGDRPYGAVPEALRAAVRRRARGMAFGGPAPGSASASGAGSRAAMPRSSSAPAPPCSCPMPISA